MRPADHLLPVMIDETGRMLKDDEVFNELAKPVRQRNAMISIGDDCQRYMSWQEGKEYFDHFGITAPTVPTVCSINPNLAVPSSSVSVDATVQWSRENKDMAFARHREKDDRNNLRFGCFDSIDGLVDALGLVAWIPNCGKVEHGMKAK